jgi:hypothetical protein
MMHSTVCASRRSLHVRSFFVPSSFQVADSRIEAKENLFFCTFTSSKCTTLYDNKGQIKGTPFAACSGRGASTGVYILQYQ